MKIQNIVLIALFLLVNSCNNGVKTLALKIKLMSGNVECNIPYSEIIKTKIDTTFSDYSAYYVDYDYHYSLKLNADTIYVHIETTVTKDERFFIDYGDADMIKRMNSILANNDYRYSNSYNSFTVVRNTTFRYYTMNYNDGIHVVYISKKGIFGIIVSNVKDNQVREDIIQSIKINHNE